MSFRTNGQSWYALDSAPAATVRFEPTVSELDTIKPLMGGVGPAATLLRSTLFLSPPAVRPYFAVCAVEGWRRVPVRQLAAWSGVPLNSLKRRLAPTGLTPAGVAAWNLALHAAWLLDVAELPASAVVDWMRLRRHAALAAVLGARAVRFDAGKVDPGAFTIALDRYIAVLRAAFRI